jgi:hypothetical protein
MNQFSRKAISEYMYPFLFVLFFISSCNNNSSSKHSLNSPIAKGEYIYRTSDEYHYSPELPKKQASPTYSWHKDTSNLLPITKAHFRCHGDSNHMPRKIENKNEVRYVSDCGGSQDHSLPLKDGKEFIYPILIDILNYVQNRTQKPVLITSGHRCPDHHAYVDSRTEHQTSKHLIGAEVTFYVEGLENQPECIVNILQDYYQQTLCYNGLKEYQQFDRWEKDTDVATAPWYNKEIFVKIYKKNEGRNLDNNHPHPYINIQVRYDRENKEKVLYSWDKAFRGYYRY